MVLMNLLAGQEKKCRHREWVCGHKGWGTGEVGRVDMHTPPRVKRDSWWSLLLCDDLKEKDGGSGREGRDIYIHT